MFLNLPNSVVAVLNGTLAVPPLPMVIELNEYERPVNQLTLKHSPKTAMYAKFIIPHFDTKWQSVGGPT